MNRKDSSPRWFGVLLVAFIITAGITSVLAFGTVRDMVASWNIQGLGDLVLEDPDETGENISRPIGTTTPQFVFDPSSPIQPEHYPEPPAWDGSSRVTILLLGLDFRDWEETGPPRADTIILVTIDPETQSAGMLSLPRDLWVAIPGFDYGKINTAYQIAELNNIPGGGPGLTMQTIEQFLGIEIDFYAQADFNAFVHLIDEMGGVKIDVPERILVDPIGDRPPKMIKPGVHTLPGDLALAYVRARNTSGGDFDRAFRQQQVIMGIRNRVLSFNLLPLLIARAPTIYQDIAGGMRTNLTLDQGIKLALLGLQLSPDSIQRSVIGQEYVTIAKSPEGLDILKPIPDKIRELRDEVFSSNPIAAPLAVDKSPQELIKEENAQLAVLNGTSTIGLASATTEYLEKRGYTVTVTGNADEYHQITTIIDYTGNPYTLQYLVELLNIEPTRIFHSFDPDRQVDIEIILGDDWAANGVTTP